MRRHVLELSLAALLGIAVLAPRAHAVELVAGGDIGIVHARTVRPQGSAFTYLPILGGHLGAEVDVFTAGVKLDFAHDMLFGRSERFFGIFAGSQLRQGNAAYNLSFEAGWHTFYDIDSGFWGGTTSETPTMPYVGARLRLGTAWPVRLGMTLFGAWDLQRKPVTVTVTDCPLLACTRGAQSHYDAGGLTIGLAFHVMTPKPRREPNVSPLP